MLTIALSHTDQSVMASSNKSPRVVPLRPRQSLTKDRFPTYFNAFRPQAYTDNTTARGGSHNKYVFVTARL